MRARRPRTLRDYARLGVRYLTLTHFRNYNWADPSTDTPKHNGLTDFGKDVVRELNRLGVMVDISHVADKTVVDVLAITTVPLIASHSSCRVMSNHRRNMTDDMLRALARNGSVIMINYEVSYLSEENRVAREKSGGVVQILAGRRRPAMATRHVQPCRLPASPARRWTGARSRPCRGRRSSITKCWRSGPIASERRCGCCVAAGVR